MIHNQKQSEGQFNDPKDTRSSTLFSRYKIINIILPLDIIPLDAAFIASTNSLVEKIKSPKIKERMNFESLGILFCFAIA